MHKARIKNLKELTSAVLTEMEKAHYCWTTNCWRQKLQNKIVRKEQNSGKLIPGRQL